MAKIIGNPTVTPPPKPDWNQTDSTKGDYIKNKPQIISEKEVKDYVDDKTALLDDFNTDIGELYGRVDDIDTQVGDIETALDSIITQQENIIAEQNSIIEIQNNLIGNSQTITFGINYGDFTKLYDAESGMTWEEWCLSEYNTIGAYVDGADNAIFYSFEDEEGNWWEGLLYSEYGDSPSSTEVIVDKAMYVAG